MKSERYRKGNMLCALVVILVNTRNDHHLLKFCSCKHWPYLEQGTKRTKLFKGHALVEKGFKQFVPLGVIVDVFWCELYELTNQSPGK